MKYFLHPDAEQDIADAALYYQQQAGSPLSQALFVEFERSVERLLQHPKLGMKWRCGTPVCDGALSLCAGLSCRKR